MDHISDFEKYLYGKDTSGSSVSAYLSDVKDLASYLASEGTAFEDVTEDTFRSYTENLSASGKSRATVNRRISSIRSFYDFLISEGIVRNNPCRGVKAEKLSPKEIIYISEEDMVRLVESPSGDVQGLRDRAILEMMYAAGLKVSELCSLDISDLNLKVGYISVNSKDPSKTRIVPIGKYCIAAVKEYMLKSRRYLLGKNEDKGELFLNYMGKRITRQGVWKILKSCGTKCGIETEITPQVIRNSFAVHLIQNGADLKSLQEMMGLDDINAAEVYLKFRKNRVMDVYHRSFPRA